MAINSIYPVNQRLRLSGLASGLDTESIINDLMKIEQLKVDKLKQDKQLLEWRRDDYREIINLIRGFHDKFFDILYAETNMRSPNAYKTYVVQSSKEEYLTVTANADAIKRGYQITGVKLATAAYVESPASVSKPIQGKVDVSGETINLDGKSIVITLDGVTKLIEFKGEYSKSDFRNRLEELLNEAFGVDTKPDSIRIKVTFDESTGVLFIEPSNPASNLTIEDGNAMAALGLKAKQSNKINLDSTLLGLRDQFAAELTFNNNEVRFSINGQEFKFSGSTTLRQVISEINASDAGVTIYYSSITDSFRLENKAPGVASGLDFKDLDDTNFLAAIGLNLENVQAGEDAVLKIKNGVDNEGKDIEIEIIRSSNTFTLDGITYNLKQNFKVGEDNDYINITVAQDVTQAFENIKNFVDEYNKLIDKINGKLKEERFRDYPPLTESQKEAMSEKEIELWEEKARSGMLRNDSTLQNIVYSLRRALVEGIEGISIGLSSIGITTSSNYNEGGKLHINEKELKEALQTKGDVIAKLFSQESEIKYSPDLTSEQRAQRYRESGLIHRIYDILQDNTRTTRDKDGRKGTLLEKAGIVGDASEFRNILYDQLKDMDKRINRAIERMYEAEERYWRQFTALETALQQMYSQSAWLYQQLGMGMS